MNAREQQRMTLIESAIMQRQQLQQLAKEWSQDNGLGLPQSPTGWLQLASVFLNPGAALPAGKWVGWLSVVAVLWKVLERQDGAPLARWGELAGQLKNTVQQWRGQAESSPVRDTQPRNSAPQ